jgi:2-dehydro-3-deoxy-D-arabinonate dehydratase
MFPDEIGDPLTLEIRLTIERPPARGAFWSGEASTSHLHRTLDELAGCLYDALEFPDGAVLLTGTSIVPPAEFTLAAGDVTTIEIDGIGRLVNTVRVLAPRNHAAG